MKNILYNKGVMNVFTATLNRGFQLDFPNGVTISVQWGHGNYCSNRDLAKGYLDALSEENALRFTSQTAEVLIEKPVNGRMEPITSEFAEQIGERHDGRVCGWLNAEQVADAIEWARYYK